MSLSQKTEDIIQDEVLEANSPGNKFTGTIVDGILEVFENVEEHVTVTLPVRRDGAIVMESIKFRVLKDDAEANRIKRAASEWIVQMLSEARAGSMLPIWAENASTDPKTLADVFLMAHLAVDEDWKSELPWLILAKRAHVVFRKVFNDVTGSSIRIDESNIYSEIAAEKKS